MRLRVLDKPEPRGGTFLLILPNGARLYCAVPRIEIGRVPLHSIRPKCFVNGQ
jgi:hypothetical protein